MMNPTFPSYFLSLGAPFQEEHKQTVQPLKVSWDETVSNIEILKQTATL